MKENPDFMFSTYFVIFFKNAGLLWVDIPIMLIHSMYTKIKAAYAEIIFVGSVSIGVSQQTNRKYLISPLWNVHQQYVDKEQSRRCTQSQPVLVKYQFWSYFF